ncbi:MAG: PLP-dependent transferase [Verrucomicrobiota bacterium]|nr:PLP-dependent transferase [Verrucomicrobiota bacterium]
MSNEPSDSKGFETRAIHSGRDFVGDTRTVTPPVWLTSTFEYGNPNGFDYTRSGNPNFRLLDRTIASLEGAAHATSFGSGVSAITAIVSTLKSGDVILAEENIYGCTFRLFAQVFAKFGVEVSYVDFTDHSSLEKVAGHAPAVVWIESPTNPNLKIIDIAAVADAAHAAGAALVVDNTFASSYLQRPIELGADLSLISLTKYTNGHSDALVGSVCTNSDDWQEKLIFAQKALGLQPSPMDCWLTLRGAKTEAIRMERHCSNALAFATFLEDETNAVTVRYPFLASHPQHELAKRQMAGGSGIVTVDFGRSLEDTMKVVENLTLFPKAESLGGIESLVCHPASMTHAAVPKETREAVGITDSLVRFSIGIETVEDLIGDVREALQA